MKRGVATMKEVKLLSLILRNFKGAKERDISFHDGVNVISGPNASGKTTINDGWTYLNFGKDSEGNSKFAIRPVDSTGKEIDNIETSVEGRIAVDGKEVSLMKIVRQIWTRHRGSSAPTYEGNETLYFIDGVPRKKKEYDERVAEIISEDKFRLISDLGYFVNLKDKDKKEILLKLVGDISDEDVVKSDPEKWSPIADDVLNLGDADAKARAKSEITKLNARQKEIPARIDELRRQVTEDPSTVEYEKKISDLNEQIAAETRKLDSVQKMCNLEEMERQKKSFQMRMRNMLDDANMDIRRKRQALSEELLQIGIELNENESNLRLLNSQITAITRTMDTCRSRIGGLKEKVKVVSARQFDENETICKSCGQVLPTDRIEEIKSRFNEAKILDLSNIQKEGETVAAEYHQKEKELGEIKQKMLKIKESIDAVQKRQDAVKADIEALPKEVSDLLGDGEYEALKAEIAYIDRTISEAGEKEKEAAEIRKNISSLNAEVLVAKSKIAEIDAKRNQNIAISKRIAELTEEQRQNGQKIALAEQKIILLEDFSMTKSRLLSQKVTDNFEIVNFSLFNTFISGGISETCEITVGGVRYKDLNTGARIAASLDILRTFQKKLGISAPIFVDGAEAINECNVPEMPCQLILLKVDDGEGLTIS